MPATVSNSYSRPLLSELKQENNTFFNLINRLEKLTRSILNNPGKAIAFLLASQVISSSALSKSQNQSSIGNNNLTQASIDKSYLLADRLAIMEHYAEPILTSVITETAGKRWDILTREKLNTKRMNRLKRNTKDIYGQTSLHSAVKTSLLSLVRQELIREGVDINATNNFGYTPFRSTEEGGWREVIEYLSSQRDRPRRSIEPKSLDHSVIQFLVEKRANTYAKRLSQNSATATTHASVQITDERLLNQSHSMQTR